MEKSRVVLLKCKDYTQKDVNKTIKKGIEMLGGINTFFKKEEKILLKPNLLSKAVPEKAVTTHPAVFRAVGELLKESGYKNLYYGDSPGNPMYGSMRAAETCGLRQPAEELGIMEGDFGGGREVLYEEGKTETKFFICNAVLECDAILNICKMKTHQLERITGAAKNLFGAVYGLNKSAFHAKYTNAEDFAGLIADLNNFLRPRLHIMDGITAMEGNGPQSGNPKDMGLILMSADPIALDTIFAKLIYLNPELVPTNRFGEEYGVGNMEAGRIEVMTEEGCLTVDQAADIYGTKDFDVYRGTDRKTQIKMLKHINPFLEKKPYILKDRCVKCGICAETCPLQEKAIVMKGYPKYDYRRCIKCYCCQEMCPQKAIDVKTPWIVKMADRNWKI